VPESCRYSPRSRCRIDDKHQAFVWWDKAFAEHDPFLVYIKVDPNFDVLRVDRFQALLSGMNCATAINIVVGMAYRLSATTLPG
jgi:hypothetical protein